MRGQVTAFIIMGLVIMVLIAFAFVMAPIAEKEEATREIPKVSAFVTACIEGIASDGARLIAAQGGRLAPDRYFEEDGLQVSYGYLGGQNTLPTRAQMERDLAAYIDIELPRCAGNLSPEKPNSTVTIAADRIHVRTVYPVIIKNERQEVHFGDSPSELGRLHSSALEILSDFDPEWIDMTALAMRKEEVNLVPRNNSIIYYLKDGIVFAFATENMPNLAPVIELPERITLPKSMPWLYKVVCTDPEGDRVRVQDDTPMLETLFDGSILSTPEIAGEFNVTFVCEDAHYNQAKKSVVIEVT